MSYIGNEPIVSATRTVTEITATAGQTVFTANGGYTVGFIDVFVNGSQLTASDFTATNGSTITLNEAATVNDIVRLVAWGTFTASNLVAPNYTGTLTGGTGVVNIGSGQIYKDASGNVGIGTTSTLGNSLLNVAQGVVARNSGGTSPYFQLYNANASTDLKTWRIGGGPQGQLVFDTVNDAYSVGTERMRIDSSGRVTMPFQPAFQAVLNGNVTNPGGSATRLTTWNKVSNAVINARDAAFSTANGRFTAPVAGLYLMGIHLDLSGGLSTNYYLSIGINGGNRQYDLIEDTTIASNGGFFVCRIVPMAVNDYAEIYMLGGNWTLNGGGNQWNTRWEGFLIS